MKIRIIKEGLFGNPELKVGMEFSLNGHPPVGWAGYYEVVSDDDVKGKETVTNPKRDPPRSMMLRDGKKGGSLPKAKKAEVKEGGSE